MVLAKCGCLSSILLKIEPMIGQIFKRNCRYLQVIFKRTPPPRSMSPPRLIFGAGGDPIKKGEKGEKRGRERAEKRREKRGGKEKKKKRGG